MASLEEWFQLAERGTSGDMVYSILYSWKRERETCALLLEEMQKNLIILKKLLKVKEETV